MKKSTRMEMFSGIVKDLVGEKNSLFLALGRRKSKRLEVLDFTQAVTGKVGFSFPGDLLREALLEGLEKAKFYQPDCLGQETTRESIASFYGDQILPNQVLVTPGSSLSYLYLFRLLANPGEEILCPEPSYPLFEFIAKMADVKIATYPIKESEKSSHWVLDLEELENRITTKTRAMVFVSPHNPTGMVISEQEFNEVAKISCRHQIPIIQDEVFSEFLFENNILPRAMETDAPLVFTLNGISKMLALPGMKLGWLTVSGDPEKVRKARETLELISDTFLPVNEAIQFALPKLLSRSRKFQLELKEKVNDCLKLTDETLQDLKQGKFLKPQAGFYGVLKLTEGVSGQDMALHLLEESGLLTFPGSFFDMKGEHLVFTFLQEKQELVRGLEIIARFLHGCGLKGHLTPFHF